MQLTGKRSILATIMVAVISFAVVWSMTFGLRARIFTIRADIGIPGVTKMYGATLTNRGLLPVRTSQCDFVNDAMWHGRILPYAVQRWDQAGKQWETVAEEPSSEFCKPYPLGIVKGEIVDRWLWPGQRIKIDAEATAGRGGFNLGDRARFVVFLRAAGDYKSSVPTNEFVIDEQLQNTTVLRVKH